jgi:hypothetical protein
MNTPYCTLYSILHSLYTHTLYSHTLTLQGFSAYISKEELLDVFGGDAHADESDELVVADAGEG